MAKWQTALCKRHLLAGQTRNVRAANAFATLILIGCRDVLKQRRLANENLMIPEGAISMPKLARICTCSLCSSVELEILFQNGRSAFSRSAFFSENLDLNNHLVLCIDNNDNQMPFVGHIVYLCPLWHHFHPRSTWATNNLYALQKSYDCPII